MRTWHTHDRCFVETPGLGVKAFAEPPSAEQLALMQAASPVAHIDKVKAPVLLMLGAKDRRVPPSNGLQVRRRGAGFYLAPRACALTTAGAS